MQAELRDIYFLMNINYLINTYIVFRYFAFYKYCWFVV